VRQVTENGDDALPITLSNTVQAKNLKGINIIKELMQGRDIFIAAAKVLELRHGQQRWVQIQLELAHKVLGVFG
jgi:hypothetical protein